MSERLWALLEASAQRTPDKAAIIDAEGAISFSGLLQEVDRAAHELAARGISSGDAVGLRLREGRAFIVAAFAAWKRGAVIVPIHYQSSASEVAEVLATTPLDAMIEDATNGPSNLSLARLERRAEPSLVDLVPGAAYLRYTSGTTGESKGVIITADAIIERIEAANGALRITGEDTVLCVLPMAFHFLVSIVLYLKVGATLLVHSDLVAESLITAACEHRATFLYASPLHLRLLASENSSRAFGAVTRVVSTSSALPADVERAFTGRFGIPIAQGYGIIECGLPLVNLSEAHKHPEAVGGPSPGFEIAIFNADGVQMAGGETGELAVRGPGMFSAYLRPFARAEGVMHEGWFRTGDLAAIDREGRVRLLGRLKAIINMAGNKVFPEEVEQVLEEHPAVERARVYGVRHARFGETIAAEVVLRSGVESPRAEELIRYCRGKLSPYKVPATLAFVSNIAETGSGKIRRA